MTTETKVEAVAIVCDWRDANPFPRFIEAEVNGRSVSLEWRDRPDGLKELIFPTYTQASAVDQSSLTERVAVLTAHRACHSAEHDPPNGRIHGYCIVCGIPFPCEYVGEPCPECNAPQPPAGTSVSERAIPMDKGPWRAGDDGRNVYSDDFTADVSLRIDGDFLDDHHRKDYAVWLARTLNGEQALTQQRVCPACASDTESYCCACGWASVESTPQPGAEALREAAEAFLEASDARDNEETATQYPQHELRLSQYKAARDDLESLLARGADHG